MRADEFVTRRRPEWDRLEKLLQRAGTSRVGGLLPTEVLSLAALYRRATADFARAKRDWPTEPVAGYLNGLVARGHAAVYRQGGNLGERIAVFYKRTLPQTYREAAPIWWRPRFCCSARPSSLSSRSASTRSWLTPWSPRKSCRGFTTINSGPRSRPTPAR